MPQPDAQSADVLPATLATALAVVQTRLPVVAKTQTANVRSEKGSYSYDYADLADVSEAILPILGAVGLSWTCRPTFNAEGKFVLAYKLLHASGESEAGEYPLAASGTPQAMGSAISYARRYTLCAVTGVAPKGDDDDAAAASTVAKPRQAQRRTQGTRPQAGQDSGDPQPAAQRASASGQAPALPHEQAQGKSVQLLTGPQRGMVLALFGNAGIDDRDERLDISRRIVGRRELGSANELTAAEASRLIDKLQEAEKHPDGFSGFLAQLFSATEEDAG